MVSNLLPSFFDELEKIATAGDLMTPAVVSDSAVVDGPPATPFTKRKGYRKLTQTGPTKEASLKDFLMASRKQAKKVPKVVEKIPDAINKEIIKRPKVLKGVDKASELLYRLYHQ